MNNKYLKYYLEEICNYLLRYLQNKKGSIKLIYNMIWG